MDNDNLGFGANKYALEVVPEMEIDPKYILD